jgi:glycosyltransferase involved in cell wall biosynthesis
MNFVMVCQRATGDDNYDQLVSNAKSLENLTFIPRVSPSEIDRYFQSAAVFVNTSESEGFPNTFIEACKWSVPILSLNVNPDGFLNEFNCGWCADNDWAEFVSKLKLIIEPERQKEYGVNARAYVERHHDISKVISDYKLLFVRSLRK